MWLWKTTVDCDYYHSENLKSYRTIDCSKIVECFCKAVVDGDIKGSKLTHTIAVSKVKKVKLSLQQAVEAYRVVTY
jgi:hypothetical protein